MPAPSSFNDYGPITWVRRTPVYLTTIITAAFVLGMFITVFLATAGFDISVFAFKPFSFWHGQVWRILTYPLIAKPQFFYIFSIFFFYWFGVDVERYLGRRRYAQLFTLLLVTPALILTLWWKAGGIPGGIGGSVNLSIGFFVAFATLYPNLEYWNWITMKWLAFAGIVLDAMNYLPDHDWVGLSLLLSTCAAAFGYIRLLQHGGAAELQAFVKKLFKRKPKLRVVPKPAGDDVHESIDPLLDKISKLGLSSLTSREREQLQRARENLLKKQE